MLRNAVPNSPADPFFKMLRNAVPTSGGIFSSRFGMFFDLSWPRCIWSLCVSALSSGRGEISSIHLISSHLIFSYHIFSSHLTSFHVIISSHLMSSSHPISYHLIERVHRSICSSLRSEPVIPRQSRQRAAPLRTPSSFLAIDVPASIQSTARR